MRKILQIFTSIALVLISYTGINSVFAGYNTAINVPNEYVNIGTPQDLVVLPSGDIWYVDSQNYRVVKIDQSGNILRTVGRQGSELGEFSDNLSGITTDLEGNLYVLGDRNVYVLDDNGAMIDTWGEDGTDDSQFQTARGITYDALTDSILVSDWSQHKVMSFTKDGVFKFKIGSTSGTANGKFTSPWSLTTDSNGKVYVVDGDNHRVQVFSKSGTFLFKFGSEGTGNGQFTFPKDVEILSNGRIVVTSQNSQKIQVFSSTGTYITSWGVEGDDIDQFRAPQYLTKDSSNNLFITDWSQKAISKYTNTGTHVLSIRNSGNTNNKLTTPSAVDYDAAGNMYILDNGSNYARVQKFTNSGSYIGTILTQSQIGGNSYHMVIRDDYIYITHNAGFKKYDLGGGLALQAGGGGTDDGLFNDARGIDIDSAGNIYIADFWNNRVQKFDSSGNFISKFGVAGTASGEMLHPQALYIDADDNIFVSSNFDSEFARLQVFNTSGVYQFSVGSSGGDPGQFSQSLPGIIKDADDNLYVTDSINHRIVKYNSTYTFVEYIGSFGGGSGQFYEPGGLAYRTVSDSLAIADTQNHRVQHVATGVRIYNLIPSIDVQRSADDESLVNNYYDPTDPGMDEVSSQMYFGDYIVADFDVDLTNDRDWSEVNTVTAPTEFKTIVENLDIGSTPGLTTSTNIYVPREIEQRAVFVCPGVSNLSDINFECTDGYYMDDTDPDLEEVTVDGNTYWRVLEVTNSGIMGVFPVSHFEVQIDDLTVETGSTINVTVIAADVNNNPVEDYTGEVNISIDGQPDVIYTFVPEDKGTHTFVSQYQLNNPRDYIITVQDTVDTELVGQSATIEVSDPENSSVDNSGGESPIYALANTGKKNDIKVIIDDIVDGNNVDNGTNNPTENPKNDTTNPQTTEKTNLSFLYWLVPLLLLLLFISYRSLNIDDNK